jgi:hypothetical protein
VRRARTGIRMLAIAIFASAYSINSYGSKPARGACAIRSGNASVPYICECVHPKRELVPPR